MYFRLSRFAWLVCAWAAAAVSCHSSGPKPVGTDAEAFFLSDVRPILEMNCLPCHNGLTPPPGRLDLTTREKALAGRRHGRPFLSPGHPDDSLLLTAISRIGTHPKLMPQRDLSLTEDDIGTLREWIKDGAAWPTGPTGTLQPRPNPEFQTPEE
jgi:hypothetical protein